MAYPKKYHTDEQRRAGQTERQRRWRAQLIAFVWDYKANHPCVDCGESDPIVLEFDHVRDQKVAAVGRLVGSGAKLQRITDEIAKCEVRCANCHRRVTHFRRLAD